MYDGAAKKALQVNSPEGLHPVYLILIILPAGPLSHRKGVIFFIGLCNGAVESKEVQVLSNRYE